MKNEIIEILKQKCNGCDLPMSLDVELVAKLLSESEYFKKLEHHKDSTCGLWAFDCNPKELLNKFNASQSDAHSIECGDFEQLISDWGKFCNDLNFNKSPFFQIDF